MNVMIFVGIYLDIITLYLVFPQIYVGVGKKILDFEAFSPDGNINPAVGPEPLTQDP